MRLVHISIVGLRLVKALASKLNTKVSKICMILIRGGDTQCQ
nr:MAG TPA: hypothetical protein [Caudoviricetes sp.]